jgi:hypothetical protein
MDAIAIRNQFGHAFTNAQRYEFNTQANALSVESIKALIGSEL